MGGQGWEAEPKEARAAVRAAAAPGSTATAPSPGLESRKGGTGGKQGLCSAGTGAVETLRCWNLIYSRASINNKCQDAVLPAPR